MGQHCASFFGIVEVVAGVIEMGCYNIDGEDFSGYMLLAWALHNKNAGEVKALLDREGVNSSKSCNRGRTLLLIAARGGYEEVVKILLRWEEVSPDMLDNSG